jgi:ATP-dependent DNA helicase DinG
MAAAVSDVFEAGGVLLAEGGTGTGKTLAYLVPAILCGQRVLVSTGTKNLQEQIFFKDIPLLRDALDVPFTATYMKGRGNFLCLHRFASLTTEADLRTPQDRQLLADLADWAASTETGDRAEVEDLPDDLPLWSEIAATSENCLGAECPEYDECFVTRMRRRAAESDLVIVNHHLLCADAAVRQSSFGEVIPECHHAVIDEAHQLEDIATQYFGLAVSSYRLDELVRDGERALGASDESPLDARHELTGLLGRVRQRAHALFDALTSLREFGRRDDRLRIDAERLEPCAGAGLELAGSLESVESAIALLEGASDDLQAVGRRAGEIRDQLRFVLRAADPDFVYFLERRGRGVFLRAAPIDVSTIVRELLLDRMHATVLTSATLTVEGSFDYVRGRLGVRDAHEIRLSTEFDYATQTILYLPRGMPEPRSPTFCAAVARQVIELLRRSAGRAFVLFTSYANLREVQATIEGSLDYPLFVQGTAPRSALLRDFRDTPHAVLLATSSFWQGVDVVGEALSCVIIDKLPFAAPADPVTAARIEAIQARGDDPFHDYQVPLATLTLLQGLGRLIRHRQDRGVLAILDPRLETKGYGARFLASLPPAPITHELADVASFFTAGGAA